MATREKNNPWDRLGAKLAAEALATFMVTGTATCVDVLAYRGDSVDYVSRWLARGFVVAVTIYAFSEVSGAHGNPAVTFGFWVRGVMHPLRAALYVAAQFGGALLAAGLLLCLFRADLAAGASHPSAPFTPAIACASEFVVTAVLMLVILVTATSEAEVGKAAAIAVGFTVAACGMVAGPISGASMNPARTLAPELLSGSFGYAWLYLVGPLAGSALAVVIDRAMTGPASPHEARTAKGR
ncbi:MAG: aquaporin [Candidatus Eremiobacteraeota bacterium]|nr:aquaporin [Candidatus Eremiobacteraeota bacterium]